MENNGKGESRGFITYNEYNESQLRMQDDLSKRFDKYDSKHEKLEDKIESVDDKVEQVRALVLPLTVATQNTADNTKEMTKVLKAFTTSQYETNDLFLDKLHGQDLKIKGLENITQGLTSKKKYNVGVTVAAIGFAGVVIGGLFQLAPLFFN